MMRFLEYQGYKVRTSVLYQDNEVAIKMERNSNRSSSRRTRHFDIKYFLMKDVLKREKVDVVYCPTNAMVADFFTKPLQGRSLHKFRRVIMGMDHTSILSLASAPVESRAKDSVGESTNEQALEKICGYTTRFFNFITGRVGEIEIVVI